MPEVYAWTPIQLLSLKDLDVNKLSRFACLSCDELCMLLKGATEEMYQMASTLTGKGIPKGAENYAARMEALAKTAIELTELIQEKQC